jgi:hypothetical protein
MSSVRSRIRLTCAIVLGIAAAGCAGAAARAGGRTTPALRIVSQLPPAYQARFTIDDAYSSRSFGTALFRQDAGETVPHSLWQSLPDGSPVVVEVSLLGDGDAPLASGRIRIPRAERDWFYEAQVQVVRFAPGVPMPPCMGCFGEARFPVRPGGALTENDSLVVTWSARHAFRPMPPV